jgi:hypothetical protein
MTWLLRLYPRAWRRRYGAEVEELVASQRPSLQLAVDLIGGAIDARMKPQAFARRLEGAAIERSGGKDMVHRLRGCRDLDNMTTREALLSAALTIGAALVVAAIMLIGSNDLTETIGLVMFPGVLVIGMQPVLLRGHSLLVKIVMTAGPLVVLLFIGLAAGLLTGD